MSRKKLPRERLGITHKVSIGGVKIYINTGEYEDGRLGEIFIRVDKEGGELRVYDVVAIQLSMMLQHGMPLLDILAKMENQKYEPAGVTSNPDIPFASSISDYIAKWLKNIYGAEELENEPESRGDAEGPTD